VEKQAEIEEEVFDALVEGPVEDLRRSGLDRAEIFFIIEEQFGPRYVHKSCEEVYNDM